MSCLDSRLGVKGKRARNCGCCCHLVSALSRSNDIGPIDDLRSNMPAVAPFPIAAITHLLLS